MVVKENWAQACVDRLTDNYEWQDTMDTREWWALQVLMADAINASPELARLFINECTNQGVVEEDYFSFGN